MHTKFKYFSIHNIYKIHTHYLCVKEIMVFKKQSGGAGEVHTGTEAWNIAQYFTGFSIAVPLRELNELEDVARFGTLNMDEDIMMSDDRVDRRRSDSVRRYWQKLKQIVADTLFKVKAKDKAEAMEIHEWMLELPKYFDGLLITKKNQVNNEDTIEVDEELLTVLLDQLVLKKQKYLYILDRTGLIFRENTEVDLDALMKEYSKGG